MPKKIRNLNYQDPSRTTQELRIAAHHLRYERAMLDFVGKCLTQNPQPTGLNYAAMMESFLIHARIINEFFYGWEMAQENKKKLLQDDVIVEDFFGDQKPWVKPQSSRLPDHLVQLINDQLSHLTYARQIGKYGDWDFVGIRNSLISLIDLFFQNVAPENVERLEAIR